MRHQSRALLLLFVLHLSIVPCDLFEVYWNVPTSQCVDKKIDIPLNKYGILFNSGQKFEGEEVVIFYEDKFGLYPYYKDTKNTSSAVHGGLPQLVNMTAHLLKAEEDIKKAIPHENFSGLAILDFEYWRPQYKLNWSSKRIYRNESERIVRERTNSTLNDTEVKRIAAEEFDEAAYNFTVETIRLAKQLRPGGKWGFYGLPYCNYNAGKGGEYNCSEEFQGYNDGILNILNESTALYPSIYLQNDTDTDLNFRYVYAILNETNRVLAMLNYNISAYPYSGFEYRPKIDPFLYYSKEDLCNEVKQVADFGMQGTIVWSTSKNMSSRCQNISAYINSTYGPYVLQLEEEFKNCSQTKCQGQGRCVLKIPQTHCNSTFNEEDYECFPPISTTTPSSVADDDADTESPQ